MKACSARPNPGSVNHRKDKDLWEVALLVDKSQHIQRFSGQNVQRALVVLVVDVRPEDVLTGILILFKLENMLDEELLQLLVGEVDAELLKAVRQSTETFS